MVYCGQATSVNHQPTHSIAYARRCKRWSCPGCHQENCRCLKRLAHAGNPNLFYTLTVNPATGTGPTDRAHRLRDGHRLIRRRAIAEAKRDPNRRPRKKALARDWPPDHPKNGPWPNQVRLKDGKLPFALVIEQHESGEAHAHILARARWISQRWLSAQLEELTGAFIVDVRRIRNKRRAASYVAKYVGKGPAKFPGMKRHWRSQDYVVPAEVEAEAKDPPRLKWWRVDCPIETYAQATAAEGWSIDWRGNSFVARPP